MPKTKAGRLTPQIHQMRKDLEEKKDALSAEERRSLLHRLKRTQRKATRIQKEEDRQAAMAKKPEKAPAEVKAEDKAEEKAAEKPEEKAEDNAESKGSDDGDQKAEA